MSTVRRGLLTLVTTLSMGVTASFGAEASKNFDQSGKPDLKSIGPLLFGPEGVLFVADPMGAAVFAIGVNETAGANRGPLNLTKVDSAVAAALGASADQVRINDLAVNPASGAAYLSVTRGQGAEATPVLVRVDYNGQITDVALDNVKFSKATLGNAPEPNAKDGRGQSTRQESITDLAFVDGEVIVAGLSNEEFASKLRAIPFPFAKTDAGASIEIFHGAHGQLETRSPVRTFVPLEIADKSYLVAAYTCTPLVRIPVTELKSGAKIKGTTIAELGNRNRPLDMIVYEKDGATYLLMANSARGVMKIPAEHFADAAPITERVADKAGIEYQTIEGLKGVQQLDRLDDSNALLLTQSEGGSLDLVTVALP